MGLRVVYVSSVFSLLFLFCVFFLRTLLLMGSKKKRSTDQHAFDFFSFFLPHALHPFLEGGGANAEQINTLRAVLCFFLRMCWLFRESEKERGFSESCRVYFLQKT